MLWIAVTLLNVPLHALASNVFRINVNDFLSETEYFLKGGLQNDET